MPRTLGQVMRGVAKALGTSLSVNEEYQIYTLSIAYDDRSQVVSATVDKDSNDREWLRVSSDVGPVEGLDLLDLLKRNYERDDHGFIGVDSSDTVQVVSKMLLQNVDETLLMDIITTLGAYADTLEEVLVGGDDK